MTREWDKTLFDRYDVVASPSQMVDFLDCHRKWWLRRVCRLPVLEGQDKFVFGNVLHAVIQRYLLADERGRDPNGNPVEIYPEGWTKDENESEVNKREAQLIQMLMKAAIESGLLRRTPGRRIEYPFEIQIVPGVGYIGALDVDEPEGVEDHKSTKARKWISSENDLANDPKMLSYGEIWRREHPEADHVKLRLNYVVKDPEDLFCKPVEVLVPTPDVKRFWDETIMPAAEAMLALKKAKTPVTEWSTIPGPKNPGVCKKYGGCTFAAICARLKTPTAYAEEINRANGKLPPPTATQTSKPPSKPMAIFSKPKAVAPAVTVVSQTAVEIEELVPQTPASKPAPAPKSTPAPAPQEAPAGPATPPWAVKTCVPCKGAGLIVAKGRACKACDSVQAQRGGPQSKDFNLVFNPDGTASWSPKDGSAPAPAPAPKSQPAPAQAAETGSVKVAEAPKAAKPKTAPKVVSPAPTPVVETPVEAPKPKKAPEPAPQQPPLTDLGDGFRLFINCLPMGSNYIDLASVLAEEGAELAREKGAESYYALDSFKRRDMLASVISTVADQRLKGQDVVAIGGSQDLKSYAEALKPLAAEVFIGVF